jgi:hypothetical protein
MKDNNGSWLRSFLVTSPVIIAAVASIFFAYLTVTQEEETVEIPDIIVNGGNGESINITAFKLYDDFIREYETADAKYSGANVNISGEVANWGIDEAGRYYVTLYTDDVIFSDNILCRYLLDYKIIFDRMHEILDSTIVIFGTCNGYVDGVVIVSECFSESIPAETEERG